MTPIDARLQFKMETGIYPMWKFHFSKSQLNNESIFYGKFKTEYGQWLEEKLGNSEKLRNQYLKDTGYRAVNWRARIKMAESLRSAYSEWLEEQYINKNHA